VNERKPVPTQGWSKEFHDEEVQAVLERWASTLPAAKVLRTFVLFSAFAFVGKQGRKAGWFKRTGGRFFLTYARNPLFSAELLCAIERARERQRTPPRTVKGMGIHFANVINSPYHTAEKLSPGLLSNDRLADVLKNGLQSHVTGENLKQALSREIRRRREVDDGWSKRLREQSRNVRTGRDRKR
jgi:hypothetical protein